MLIARAPMRISFGGGGTDLEAYYANYGGVVISTAINKYFYAVITTDESDDLQVISADYRSLFRHSPYNDLFWNGDLALPKAILHHFGIRRGINLFVASEVPPGTGLGSSSAAAVTMVRALSTLVEQPMTKQQDRKSTRLNSSHTVISYAVFCLKKKKKKTHIRNTMTQHAPFTVKIKVIHVALIHT